MPNKTMLEIKPSEVAITTMKNLKSICEELFAAEKEVCDFMDEYAGRTLPLNKKMHLIKIVRHYIEWFLDLRLFFGFASEDVVKKAQDTYNSIKDVLEDSGVCQMLSPEEMDAADA